MLPKKIYSSEYGHVAEYVQSGDGSNTYYLNKYDDKRLCQNYFDLEGYMLDDLQGYKLFLSEKEAISDAFDFMKKRFDYLEKLCND